eukprot:CAMPEP_0202449326 /NCGR_PEP_ID=MMETSP1360-20130828/8066_1 /ASSEMBLY_ACC=CAM_ASM_000848 /TAXON_ID=515479 /ORGANISM="Licmophora paradoxa, Strain CCMP2313" /LENGTH=200 /DNA_ID=CAMNT_0049067209 /DNA_START=37 /DNA_END=639 /DNA_ORIENTATION=+
MEVASPLPFGGAGSKRSFGCSPANTVMAMEEDFVHPHQHQPTKRRRFDMHHSQNETTQQQQHLLRTPFSSINSGSTSNKRIRTTEGHACGNYNTADDSNIAEMERLRQENSALQSQMHQIKSDHDNTLHQNNILKKLVAHQHNNATQEMEALRKQKEQAQDTIKRMEQLILTLRYHLQAQQTTAITNDFMGFSPRPPDVF